MDVYHEIIEPSRVTHSISCFFTNPVKKDLIIAKGTLLQVFETVDFENTKKLNIIQSFNLEGLITDIKPIRTVENASHDYLLVSTNFAKISLIKWDHQQNSISTISLHYYENVFESQTYEKYSNPITQTKLIVDPNNHCCCLFYKDLLVFLPFVQSNDDDDDYDNKNVESNLKSDSLKITESSFVINASKLDSSIGSIIDIQFLHNYREPTIAILFEPKKTWAGNLSVCKDNVKYLVLSLDLVQKTSTAVISVGNLPFDIDRILPLHEPLSGSLLLGSNELIHIDNSGIARGIAVNEYTKSSTDFKLTDQTDLLLRLEESLSYHLTKDKVLLMLSTGVFYYVTFIIDGKSIKNIKLEPLPSESYEGVILTNPNSICKLDDYELFIGNSDGESLLLGYASTNNVMDTHKPSIVEQDDDDLYEDEDEKVTDNNINFTFSKHDSLLNCGPISNFTLGHISTVKFKNSLFNPNYKEVAIVATTGSGKQGAVSIFSPSVQPVVRSSLSFSQINKMWTLHHKSTNYLITTDTSNSKSEIFLINKQFDNYVSKDFSNNEVTVNIGFVNSHKSIMQITSYNVWLYDLNFKKLKNVNFNKEVLFATVNDPYLLVTFTNGEVEIHKIEKNALERVSVPDMAKELIITTGYIADSKLMNITPFDIVRGTKRNSNSNSKSIEIDNKKKKIFLLVSGDNRIIIFEPEHNNKCYQLNHLDKLTESLQLDFLESRDTLPDPFIKQVILNDLGDSINKDEYLTILTIGGELYIYKLYSDGQKFRFIKEKTNKITGAPENVYPLGTMIERRLVYMPDVNGFSSIFVTGMVSYWISKVHTSTPRIYKFTKIPAVSFASYVSNTVSNGFIYLDNGKNARICDIPTDYDYSNNWPIKQVALGSTPKSVAYHETSDTFVVSTYDIIPYNCIDEDGIAIVGVETEKQSATSVKGCVKLLSPISWTVIDEIELSDNEVGLNVKSMVINISARFKTEKELIVYGTGKFRMEDLVSNGSFNIFEIISIIPEPGKPETNHKFKELFKEDTKGAVTSICDISGRFMVSQGQKIIIRDLQEDNTVVPVAFLDTAVYVTESKSFGNLLILGDAMKSLWLVGFDAEPFRMIMLGKDSQKLDVNCADFIVYDKQIFFAVADNDNILHLLQYDPDDVNSLGGQRLVSKSSFNLNGNSTCLRSLPKNEEFNTNPSNDGFQCVGSNIDGSFYNIFPVSESTYRRMYVLQQQIIDKELHHCGLNPRLNRLGNMLQSSQSGNSNSKPILDFNVLKKFVSLSEDRRRVLGLKVGQNAYGDIWRDFIECENTMKNL